ncbi:MAG: sugar ABC transporter permease [Armatimonadota bacterium]|nr:MAG: sugar ABC transporter permease [Armatimonadota bacterium]
MLPAAPPGSGLTRRRHEALTGGTFLLPGLFIIFLCVMIPSALALGLSFTHCSRFLSLQWAGLYNYRKLLSDPVVLKAFGNTLRYVVVFVPANFIISMAIALLLNRQFRGIKVVRSIYFVPVAVSSVVAISIFRFMFDRNYGPINAALGTLGFEKVPWLWSAEWALWAIIMLMLWKSAAFFSLILLAALQDVPEDLKQAATVDGAGTVAQFAHVTFPSIRGVAMTVIILSSIGAFRVFEPMFVLTRGGPNDATQTVALQAYDTAFTNGELGYACAISFALLAVIVAATALLNKLTARHA